MSVPLTEPDEPLPQPDATMVLVRVAMEAFVAVSPRKRGERFLRIVAEKLADEESLAQAFPIRSNARREAVRRARREAAALYEALLPVFVAALRDGDD